MILSILSPLLCILLIACIDANVKGRLMAKYAWADLHWFWKDAGVVAWRSVLAFLLVDQAVGLWYLFGWQQAVALIILGASGVESVLYWRVLKPFGIKQPAHWKEFDTFFVKLTAKKLEELKKDPDWDVVGDVRTGDSYKVTRQPIVTWFEYPDVASWLYLLPPFWVIAKNKHDVDRDLVYAVAFSGVFIDIILAVAI